jgi:hypothetical protein
MPADRYVVYKKKTSKWFSKDLCITENELMLVTITSQFAEKSYVYKDVIYIHLPNKNMRKLEEKR